MIDEYGVVVEERRGRIGIEVGAEGSCDACPIRGACYEMGNVVWMPRVAGINKGDHVHFVIENSSVLKLSSLVYGVPLAGVLAGIVAGYLWLFRSFTENPRVGLSVLLAAVIFVLCGFLISRLDRRMKERLVYSVERIPSAGRPDLTLIDSANGGNGSNGKSPGNDAPQSGGVSDDENT